MIKNAILDNWASWLYGFAPRAIGSCFILTLMTVFFGCSSSTGTKVTINENQWFINGEILHKDSPAEGLLMNVRMVNAVFEDVGPNGTVQNPGFDPEENTRQFIHKLPEYVDQGVRAFTISLQGGLPGYEGAVNSAFNADGSLRKKYMERVARVIQAADQQGVVIILTCFYQRQHSHEQALDGKQAILNAVENVSRWITEAGYTNVLLEISNEYAHGGYRNWQDGEWLKSASGQVELIQHAKATAPQLLVSTSGMGNGTIPEPIARASDFILIHFNTTTLEDIPGRIEKALVYGKPVVCNEDDKIGALGAEAARLSVKHSAGWGLMQSEKNQDVPFEFDGASDDTVVYGMISRLTTPGGNVEGSASDQLSILITTPKDGDVFESGKNITIQASPTGLNDMEGVEAYFFSGDQWIGKSTDSPWKMVWENSFPGKHNLTAALMDSTGKEILRSRLVDIEIKASE